MRRRKGRLNRLVRFVRSVSEATFEIGRNFKRTVVVDGPEGEEEKETLCEDCAATQSGRRTEGSSWSRDSLCVKVLFIPASSTPQR